jgi:hypothetical protein
VENFIESIALGFTINPLNAVRENSLSRDPVIIVAAEEFDAELTIIELASLLKFRLLRSQNESRPPAINSNLSPHDCIVKWHYSVLTIIADISFMLPDNFSKAALMNAHRTIVATNQIAVLHANFAVVQVKRI